MTDTSNTEPSAELEQLRAELATERENRVALERRSVFAEAGLADHAARELLEQRFEPGMTAEQLRGIANGFGLLPAANAAAVDTAAAPSDLDGIRRVQNATAGGVATSALPDFGDAIDGAQSIAELNHLLNSGGAGAGLGLRGRVV